MSDRNIAAELALLATDVDSLAKSLAQARAELSREAQRRARAETKAEELRTELGHARRRAQTAERELGKVTAGIEATTHTALVTRHELETRLQQAQQVNEQLRKEVHRKERERQTLELNLREVMENLRKAAQEAQGSAVVTPPIPQSDEPTLVPSRPDRIGW